MKYLKEYRDLLNEELKKKIGSKLHGYTLNRTDYDTDLSEDFAKTEAYSIETGDEDIDGIGLFLVVYDGSQFSLMFDSVPVPTSLHSRAEENEMHQAQVEIPKPMAKLSKMVLDRAISNIKKNYT